MTEKKLSELVNQSTCMDVLESAISMLPGGSEALLAALTAATTESQPAPSE